MRKKIIEIVLGVIVPIFIASAGVGVFQFTKRPKPARMPLIGDDPSSLLTLMPAAQVEQVRPLSDTLDITASGTVVPSREIFIAAEVAGKVIVKYPQVRAGNKVSKRQLLLKIDPRDLQFELDRLTQRQEQEQVNLQENQQEIQNTKRLLQVAEDQVALAETDRKRVESLDRNFASSAELDESKRALLTAHNQRVTLLNQLDMLTTRRQKLEVAIKMASTEIDQAKLNVQRTEIQSPVDGLVVNEQVEIDSYVQRGTNLMTLEDRSQMEVSCNLRMDQLYWILSQSAVSSDQQVNAALATMQQLPKIDATIRFRMSGRESVTYEWDGKLDRFEGKGLDPQSRMIPVRITVDRPDQYRINQRPSEDGAISLVRGMFVEVILRAKPAAQLLLVPKLAVKPTTDAHRVWRFVPGQRAYDLVLQRKNARQDSRGDNAQQKKMPEPAGPAVANVSDTKLEPDHWQPGILQVLDGLQVISSSSRDQDTDDKYVVCEAGSSGLQPGDLVVITPLPNIESLEEPIRVAKDPAIEQ